MRTHTIAAVITVGLLATSLTACGSTYTADDCAAAISDSSTKTNRPKECKDISDDNYMTLVMGYVLKKQGLGNVGEHPEDLLDYAEDGVVDGN